LKGELDWIVMKCLEKDRERRYESASSLSRDLHRHLADEPVLACPPSTIYRLRKFAKKHRAALVSLTVVAASLLIGLGFSAWQAIRATAAEAQAKTNETKAEKERQKAVTAAAAEQSAKQAEALQRQQAEKNLEAALLAVDRLLAQVASPDLKDIPRVQVLRRKMLQDALGLYKRVESDSGGSPAVRHRAAQTWTNLAELCAEDFGDYEAARRAHNNAIKTIQALVAEYPDRKEYRPALFSIQLSAAHFFGWGLREYDRSADLFGEARKALDRLAADNPDKSYTIDRAGLEMGLGATLLMQGRLPDALTRVRRAKDLYEQAAEINAFNRAQVWANMAHILVSTDPSGSDEAFRRSIAEFREFLRQPQPRFYRSQYVQTLIVGSRHMLARHPQECEPWLREAKAIATELCRDFPTNPHYQGFLRGSVEQLVMILESTNRASEARELEEECLAILPESGAIHASIAKRIATEADREEAIRTLTQRIEKYPQEASYYLQRAPLYSALGRNEAALADFGEGLKRNPEDHIGRVGRGDMLVRLKQYEQALADYNFSISRVEMRHVIKRRGAAYFYLNRYDDALADLTKAMDLGDLSSFWWIPASHVAECSNEHFRQALLDLADRSVEKAPPNADILLKRASLRSALQLDQLALADLSRAVQLAPANGQAKNNLAWFLVTSPDPALHDSTLAVQLAKEAIALASPQRPAALGNAWNTLAVAYYRSGDWKSALQAIQKSVELRNSGDSFDWFFLAMIHWQLGDEYGANEWYDQAADWMERNRPQDEELLRFRAEAADLLNLPAKRRLAQ
jgi:tetratricopeptide (TPR) repeat protein